MAELKIRTFDEIDEERVRWLWQPYIAFGKITVIQGDPGNGKTTLALAIAARISRRESMPTGNASPFIGNVIYQSGEDNPQDTIKPRLVACGADCSKIAFLEADGQITPEMLEEAIVGTNAKYAVLDPLQAFLNGKQNISSTTNMRPILREFGNVAARTGAAIIIIGHMNKGERSKGIYRGLGSIDITAAARSVLLIGKLRSDPHVRFMTQIKNNLSAFGKAVRFTVNDSGGVEFLGECDVSEEDLLVTKIDKKSKYEIAKEIISSLLKDGDKTSNQIYDTCLDAGVSGGTMHTVKKRLGIKSIYKAQDWYWTLNPDAKDMDRAEITETAPAYEEDEVPVAFLDEVKIHVPKTEEHPAVLNPDTTMQSPYGELTIIDWRASL